MPSPKASRLLARALELEGSDRERFFEKLARKDEAAAREVKKLLSAYERAGGFLSRPAAMNAAALVQAPQPTLQSGERIDDFTIVREIGRGAFASVYLAEQVSLGRRLALKVSPERGEEGRLMAPLEHDNIVRVFSETIDTKRRLRCLAMQYVQGPSLQAVLAEARAKGTRLHGKDILSLVEHLNGEPAAIPVAQAAEREALARLDGVGAVAWLGAKIAGALAYAHEKGVLHLDIKPANILVSASGRPLLTDFNVSSRTESGLARGGTQSFMAPEHEAMVRGEAPPGGLGPAADLFSLGVVLQRMRELEGAMPSDDPLGAVIARCTARDPKDRFATAEELRRALADVLALRVLCPPELGFGARPIARAARKAPYALIGSLGLLPPLVALGSGQAYLSVALDYRMPHGPRATRRQKWFGSGHPILCLAIAALWLFLTWRAKRSRHKRRALALAAWAMTLGTLCSLSVILGIGLTMPWALSDHLASSARGLLRHFLLLHSLAVSLAALVAQRLALGVLYFDRSGGGAGIARTARADLSSMTARQIIVAGTCVALSLASCVPTLAGPLTGAQRLLLTPFVKFSLMGWAVFCGVLGSLTVWPLIRLARIADRLPET